MLWIYCGLVFLASALLEAALAVSVTSKRGKSREGRSIRGKPTPLAEAPGRRVFLLFGKDKPAASPNKEGLLNFRSGGASFQPLFNKQGFFN
jgi:hypothetical protein